MMESAGDFPLGRLGLGLLQLRDDPELTVLSANGCFYSMLGYQENEVPALRAAGQVQVLREANPDDWEKRVRRSGGTEFTIVQFKLIRKDGHHIWVSYRVCRGEGNRESFFWGIVENITLSRRFQRIQREQKEELEALTANIPGGVLCCRDDESLTLNFVSGGFCRIIGYSREEISERFRNHFLELVHRSDRPELLEHIRSDAPWDNVMEYTFRVVGKDGGVLWMLDKARCIVGADGTVWLYSVLIDVTATKMAQDELLASEERFRLILEHVTDPVLYCNFATGEIYYSPVFRQKFEETFVCLKPDETTPFLSATDFVWEEDRAALMDYGSRVMGGEDVKNAEFRFRTRSGAYIWCSIHSTLSCDSVGQPTRLIVIFTDIDRQKKENLDLRRRAEHDLLTGLYNSVTTSTLINEAIAHSTPDERHALFVIDIDNFKKINDSLGHLSGDRLIVGTAEKLRALFRDGDILGRVGGDEFVVFMKKADSAAVAKKAEILNRSIASIGNGSNLSVPVSGSVGVALYPGDGACYDELFRNADTAMYSAKKGGKNSFRVYCRGMTFPGSQSSSLR